MKTKYVLLLVGFTGFVATVVWRENRFARQAAQAEATLSASDAKVAAALRAAKSRLVAADRERANLQAALDSFPKTPPGKPAEPAKKANPDRAVAMAEWAKAEEERQKDPQVQLRQLAAARTKLAARYGALYWKLKLAPEQIDQFETIAAKREEQDNDLLAAVLAQGVSVSDSDFVKLYGPLHQKIDQDYLTAEKDLLGEAHYQQFSDYERELPARNVVQSMAGAAVLAGTPFSPQQADQLVSILANASNNYRKGLNVNSLDIEWEHADERAREILSNEQMTAFQTLAPATGGTGRFWLRFNRVLNEAQAADRKQATAARQPGG